MNEDLATLSRNFESSPEICAAMDLTIAAERLGVDWPGSLCRWIFDWQRWLQFKEGDKDFFASRLASQPSLANWTYVELCSVESPVHKSTLALFSHTRFPNSSFHLIPGGRAELGYDFSERLQTSASSIEEALIFISNRDDYDIPVESASRSAKRPNRRKGRPSTLLEFRRNLVQYYLRTRVAEQFTEKRTVTLPPLLVEQSPTWHWTQVSETLTRGFRLPSHDEWEYLRAGGTRSLFSWGDDHRAGQREQANGFGLQFSNSSYDYEICCDDYARGGDGGGAVCGGEGYFFEQLSASPYFEAGKGHEDMLEYWSDHLCYRRVFPLIPESEAH